jgi:hypothetical protein
MNLKEHFNYIADFMLAELLEGESLSISYSGEQSYFMRFKDALVRQNGFVEQAAISVKFFKQNRSLSFGLSLHFEPQADYTKCAKALDAARNKVLLLPEDPYFSEPVSKETSNTVFTGKLLSADEIPSVILKPFKGYAFNGLHSQGKMCRGVATSSGARHWFETDNFLLDYSVWLQNGRAVKSSYADSKWKQSEYDKKVSSAIGQLSALQQEPKKLAPGKYKAYITGNALVDVTDFFHGFGERSLHDGSSAFIALKENRENFSPDFTLKQDFSMGMEPAFNTDGDLAPEQLVLVEKGKLKNTLVGNRSAKQFSLKSNGAPSGEYTRAVSIAGGSLDEKDAYKDLGTGIYISSFNYLNWSDPAVARITGMTRHACMWVENGKPVCPIADLRWDESLYNMFGKNLLGITKETKLFANTSTYEERATGGCSLPCILVRDFNCTL